MRSKRELVLFLTAAVLGGTALGQVTERVSVRSDGGQVNGGGASSGSFFTSMSANGRYVAFESDAENLVSNDSSTFSDIFVHDRQTRQTLIVSVTTGSFANGDSLWPSISADGRWVAFGTDASNLVTGDTNASGDILVRDMVSGTLELVSVSSSQVQANGLSEFPSISRDGRFVVFSSWATNLPPGGSGTYPAVFLRDRQAGTTEIVSVDSNGVPGDASGLESSVSEDGRFVVFTSAATNLVAGDGNGTLDVFVRDRQSGTTVRASVDSSGNEAQGESYGGRMSADGRFVVFASSAQNLVPGTPSGFVDIYLRDLQNGTTELMSVAPGGVRADESSELPIVSADGRWIAFHSRATNLVAGDTNAAEDVFLRDRQAGTTERMNVTSAGGQVATGNLEGHWPSLSDDGRYVAFASYSPDLVPSDTNNIADVFVRDPEPGAGTTAFTSSCDPGAGGVIACPCSNPAGGPDRGCDNSAGTGGASLAASGTARTGSDDLVFTTSGERPTALSIVVQGDAPAPGGLVYGQGVRCAAGHLRRLYTKSASGGAIVAPDFSAGDLSVTARSAQLGDPIIGAQSRWYFVYYRDPTVLGGCPAPSTFNTTQTGQIAWTF